MEREELEAFFDELLRPGEYDDYGPNGLQIEGRSGIERIAFAVSATRASVEAAVAAQVEALVVHHGVFWSFHGARPLVGPFARRVMPLVRHEINLFGYHLPLDGHPDVGNAAGIARALGLTDRQPFGDRDGMPTGTRGSLPEPRSASDLRARLEELLAHPVLLSSPDESAAVTTLGIITGAARDEWQEARDAGLDAYLTGEMSEHHWHEAQEAGMHMFAGGHHATERFGVKTLMEEVADAFDVEVLFIDSENPA